MPKRPETHHLAHCWSPVVERTAWCLNEVIQHDVITTDYEQAHYLQEMPYLPKVEEHGERLAEADNPVSVERTHCCYSNTAMICK